MQAETTLPPTAVLHSIDINRFAIAAAETETSMWFHPLLQRGKWDQPDIGSEEHMYP